ncbi:rhomboid family intramembrane serine protease [Oceaniglobus roseus]|uniref:rhomboid family intramembrane serine protease n=1 Tax=Oceaniglobus roseus TaxID=1737570 RepID=UPI000C7F76DB|nr:rhomboid family intramembrane serine protease [Kandeliimicrobium roseum]
MFPLRDHNPSLRTPFVVYALIAANVLVFLFTLSLGDDVRALNALYVNYALIPAINDPLTYVTSQFMHGGLLHLGGNMLFLWIFGDNMEDEMGHLPFLAFYLAGGVVAGIAQTLSAPGSEIPMVGASGAIAAVMGGYLLLFPKARVDVLIILVIFFRIFPIPAWIVLGAWLALQTFSGISAPGDAGGVAYWAHVGGFVAGLVLALPLWQRLGGPGFWKRTAGRPPHAEARYRYSPTSIPNVRRRR